MAVTEERIVNEVIEDLFEYHAPDEEQIEHLKAIRAGAKDFAYILDANCPSSPDRTAAMRTLQECVNTANRSVALRGRSYK